MSHHRKIPDSDAGLDGSAPDMQRFLGELVELASQTDSAHTAPVLELQLGRLLVRTSMAKRDGVDCLLIVLLLPPLGARARTPGPTPAGVGDVGSHEDTGDDAEVLWHAEEGRYVIMRHLPVSAFDDEAAVFEAIATSADQAAAWMAARGQSAADGPLPE